MRPAKQAEVATAARLERGFAVVVCGG